MKRLPPYKKRDYGISKFFPLLFWKECDMCGYEFVREWMWRVKIPVRYLNVIIYYGGYHNYICTECCKDMDGVISYRNKIKDELEKEIKDER